MSIIKCTKVVQNLSRVFHNPKLLYSSCQQQCGQPNTKDLLLKQISCCERPSNKKVTVVGAGQVGTACAVCIFMKNICDKIVIMDKNRDKALGEMFDYQHGTSVMKLPKVTSCADYTNTKDSDVIVVTAGAAQKKGQSRLDLIEINCKIFKEIIPPLAKQSPNAVLLIVANPVDILSYAAWKYSGFRPNRIISSGTDLDSSRFRFLIAQKLGISPNSVHGWVIGEHGDSSVPIWSSVNVAGVRLCELNPKMGQKDDPENWDDIHKQVVKCGGMVQNLKTYTNWAVAVIAAGMTEDVLMNNYRVHAVSTCAQDFHGICSDIFLSLPCIIGGDGVRSVVLQNLTCEEMKLLCKSATILDKVRSTIKM